MCDWLEDSKWVVQIEPQRVNTVNNIDFYEQNNEQRWRVSNTAIVGIVNSV
jgi:hypothetical protein